MQDAAEGVMFRIKEISFFTKTTPMNHFAFGKNKSSLHIFNNKTIFYIAKKIILKLYLFALLKLKHLPS